jgi:cytochrome b involved in lipid metabolism
MQIVNYCGKEATNAFNTKGGNSSHSANANSILATYKIGAVGSTAVVTPTPKSNPTPTPVPTKLPTPAPTATTQTLTSAVVATHNTQGNCWLIINNNVYDVTQYIPYHPGGTMQIVNNCGKESTSAFNTKGGGGSSHSASANSTLANYKIGALGSTTTTTPTPVPAGPTPTPQTVSLTSVVVATHNTQGNCWLIINNNVYDVTQYIPYHPGGVSRITTYCGKEASTAFNTRGGGSSHSTNANNLLAGYKIGTLNGTATITPTPTPNPNATPTPTPRPRRDDDD